ncbi:MAG: dihydroxyacetone kinase subunit DhaK [Microbacterium sp.]
MLAAAQAVDSSAGVLFIVRNYTGDVLNFEMAAELAAGEGIRAASVVVADDVAVQDSTWTAGRGVGTTVIVEKIAGAAAGGKSLAEVTAIAEGLVGRPVDGVARQAARCRQSAPSFDLPDDEMEVGVGIHGEPGRKRVPLENAHDIARDLVTAITDDADFTGAPVIVLLSGLVARLIELVIYADIAEALAEHGIEVARVLVGDYITSLDMAGCSLTLVKADDELLRGCWSTPRRCGGGSDDGRRDHLGRPRCLAASQRGGLSAHADELTALDSAIGDADHGTNMARGFKAVLDKLDAAPAGDAPTVQALLKSVGMTLISKVGGASGSLYGTLFLDMGRRPFEHVDQRRRFRRRRRGGGGRCRRARARGRRRQDDDRRARARRGGADGCRGLGRLGG